MSQSRQVLSVIYYLNPIACWEEDVCLVYIGSREVPCMLKVCLNGSAEVLPANCELGPAVRVFCLVAFDVHQGDSILFNPTIRKEIDTDEQIFRGLPADYLQNKNCTI